MGFKSDLFSVAYFPTKGRRGEGVRGWEEDWRYDVDTKLTSFTDYGHVRAIDHVSFSRSFCRFIRKHCFCTR